jgi:hypothetical protein
LLLQLRDLSTSTSRVDDSLNRAQSLIKVSERDGEVGSGHNDPLYLPGPLEPVPELSGQLLPLSTNYWIPAPALGTICRRCQDRAADAKSRLGIVCAMQFLDTDEPLFANWAARRPIAHPDDPERAEGAGQGNHGSKNKQPHDHTSEKVQQ